MDARTAARPATKHALGTLVAEGKTKKIHQVAGRSDLVALVSSFTARLYGQRRAKRKTERLVKELQTNGEE